MDEVLGIDAQARGLAVTALELPDGKFSGTLWLPVIGTTMEERIHSAYQQASIIGEALKPSLAVVEQPTAKASSTFMLLWGIYGAVVAALFPHSQLVEGIVPTSWKSKSGLNQWAKDNAIDKRGVVQKGDIKQGIISLIPEVPDTLYPNDLYDSVAIALAAYNRNLQRQGLNGHT